MNIHNIRMHSNLRFLVQTVKTKTEIIHFCAVTNFFLKQQTKQYKRNGEWMRLGHDLTDSKT